MDGLSVNMTLYQTIPLENCHWQRGALGEAQLRKIHRDVTFTRNDSCVYYHGNSSSILFSCCKAPTWVEDLTVAKFSLHIPRTNQQQPIINSLTFYLWLNAFCRINLCLTSLLILDPFCFSASSHVSFSLLLSLHFPLSLFFSLSLSLSLTPFTQMLPAAQLDRSDGMCQLGITPIPTFYTASREAGWVGGQGENSCFWKRSGMHLQDKTKNVLRPDLKAEQWPSLYSFFCILCHVLSVNWACVVLSISDKYCD